VEVLCCLRQQASCPDGNRRLLFIAEPAGTVVAGDPARRRQAPNIGNAFWPAIMVSGGTAAVLPGGIVAVLPGGRGNCFPLGRCTTRTPPPPLPGGTADVVPDGTVVPEAMPGGTAEVVPGGTGRRPATGEPPEAWKAGNTERRACGN